MDIQTLARIRAYCKVSQKAVADELGCTKQYITMVERGQKKDITQEQMLKILDAIYKAKIKKETTK